MSPAPLVLRFGTDGIRGVAFEELSVEAVTALGKAVARVIGCEAPFLVARDTRESGPALEQALIAGLQHEGASVVSVGVFPTPGLAYLSQAQGLPAAMVSASHNPYRDNGIKLFAVDGRKVGDEVEARIESVMESVMGGTGDPDGGAVGPADTPARDSGAVHDPAEMRRDYLEHLVSSLDGRGLDGLRVVVDCAHGAAVETAPAVLERLGATVEVIGGSPDGRNINDRCGSTHPDGLRRAVVNSGADAGLAFDGDADRIVVGDERGERVDRDPIQAISALDLRERGRLRGDTVVTTVLANTGFRKAMEAHGIRVVETRVGDRFVLAAMEADGYSLGGEQSGHVIFADLATTGDGVLTGLVVLDIARRAGRPLSELASVITKLPQVQRNVPVIARGALDEASWFWDEVRAVEAELGDHGRVLVRPSGTEPVVRIMIEAGTEQEAEALADRLVEHAREGLGGSPTEHPSVRK